MLCQTKQGTISYNLLGVKSIASSCRATNFSCTASAQTSSNSLQGLLGKNPKAQSPPPACPFAPLCCQDFVLAHPRAVFWGRRMLRLFFPERPLLPARAPARCCHSARPPAWCRRAKTRWFSPRRCEQPESRSRDQEPLVTNHLLGLQPIIFTGTQKAAKTLGLTMLTLRNTMGAQPQKGAGRMQSRVETPKIISNCQTKEANRAALPNIAFRPAHKGTASFGTRLERSAQPQTLSNVRHFGDQPVACAGLKTLLFAMLLRFFSRVRICLVT